MTTAVAVPCLVALTRHHALSLRMSVATQLGLDLQTQHSADRVSGLQANIRLMAKL